MALPIVSRGKTITTDNLFDFATRKHWAFNEELLGLAEAIVAISEAVEAISGGESKPIIIDDEEYIGIDYDVISSDTGTGVFFIDSGYIAVNYSNV